MQRRAAELEAAHAAPLPANLIATALLRNLAWRPGAPGAFTAIYVRADEAHGLVLHLPIAGRPRRVVFETSRAKATRLRNRALSAAIGLSAAAALTLSVGLALKQRAADGAALSRLETQAERQLRLAGLHRDRADEARALAAVRGDRGSLNDVLAALQWAATDRAADVPVEAVHWRPQGIAVEARGEASPFKAGVARRIDRPLRPGVFLWVKADPARTP